jgi:outer membrane protein assembly factor BamB
MPAGVAYDRNSGRLFVNTQSNGLRAFEYSGQSAITPLWATSVWYGDSKPPAIAEDGSLYIVRGGTGQLVELDPATGLPLRTSTATDFFTDDPPVLQPGYIWVSARHGDFGTELRVLDADTFDTVRSFANAPDYVLLRPPVLAEGTMVMPLYSGVGGSKTFQVYLVPEPASAITLLVALGGVACCRLRRIPG